MKKYISLFLSGTCLLGCLLASNTNGGLKETCQSDLGIGKTEVKRLALGGADNKVGKTFVQTGESADGSTSYLRFATPVSGNVETLTYHRTMLGKEDAVKEVTTVYAGIMVDGQATYYTDAGLTTTKPETMNYYFACYTISFSKEDYKSTDFYVYLEAKFEGAADPVKSEARNRSYKSQKDNLPYEITLISKGGVDVEIDVRWFDSAYAIKNEDITFSISTIVGAPEYTNKQQDNKIENKVIEETENLLKVRRLTEGADFTSPDAVGNSKAHVQIVSSTAIFNIDFEAKYLDAQKVMPSQNLVIASENVSTHTVTFNKNADDANLETTAKDVKNGLPYGKLPTPTREGYNFLGWFTSPEGGEKVTSTTIAQLDADQTLYAHWVSAAEYWVEFAGNGTGAWAPFKITWTKDSSAIQGTDAGKFDLETFNAKYILNGEETPIDVNNPFVGPTNTVDISSKSATVGIGFNGAGFRNTNVTYVFEFMTTSGQWKRLTFDGLLNEKAESLQVSNLKVEDFTKNIISFDVNYDGGETFAPKYRGDGEVLGKLPDPIREGYTFLGWFTAKEGGEQVKTDYVVTESKTLYAHWESGVTHEGIAISTADDLKAFFDGKSTNNGNSAYLANDIDCAGLVIDEGMSDNFNAKFDGAGYTISNLNIKRHLFYAIGSSGKVFNLNIVATYLGTAADAAICFNNKGLIDNVNIDLTLDTNLEGSANAPYAHIGENGIISNCDAKVRFVKEKSVKYYFAIFAGAGIEVKNCTLTYYGLIADTHIAPMAGNAGTGVTIIDGDA